MNLYRIDVPVWATAYIMAETQEQAAGIGLRKLAGSEVYLSKSADNEVPVSALPFTLALPDVSLSPCCTIGVDIAWNMLELEQENLVNPES